MKTFLALILSALGLQAATVQFYMTNSAGFADTNYFRLIPIENPVLANGGVIIRGPAMRCYPAATGFFATNLTLGWWQMTNSFLSEGVLFQVPDNNNTYNITNLAVSGFNTYVMSGIVEVTSTNGSVTINPANGRGIVDLAAAGSVPLLAGSNIVIYQSGGSNVINSTASGSGSGVTNNQQLPGISAATNFQANLGGSSNLFVNPQTLYVRTNGNNTTASRGDPALAWSTLSNALLSATPGDTVQIVGAVYAPGTAFLTNSVNLVGSGTWLTISNQNRTPGILMSNTYLQDLRITNVSDVESSSALGNASWGDYYASGTRIVIRGCYVYSPSIAAYFKFNQNTGAQYQSTLISDSVFEGFHQAFEVWGAYTRINNCRFSVPHAHSSTENIAATMTFNDNSTNFLQSCFIEALGSTNAGPNCPITVFQGSYDQFDQCVVRVQNSLQGNRNDVNSDCAIHFAEALVTARFNNCFFQLAPPGSNAPVMLAYIESQAETAPTSGVIEFNNCFYSPETNGVIVVNRETNVVVTVRGGNLKRANFLHPEYVNWLSTVVATNLDAAAVVNSSGSKVADFANFILNDEAGMNSVIWGGGAKVLGNAGQIAVDWLNRELDDPTSNPILDWGSVAGGPRLDGNWTALGRLTNLALTAKTVVAADPNKALSSIPNAIGYLNNDGSGNFSWSSAGIGGQATNAVTSIYSNNVSVINPATNIDFWIGSDLVLGLTNRNGNGHGDIGLYVNPSLTNIASETFTNSGQITAATAGSTNVLEIKNASGQSTARFGTNGYTSLGTNNQMYLDTSGNLGISGQFIGSGAGLTAQSVPETALAAIAGFSTLANSSSSAASPAAVGTPVLMDVCGSLTGGVLVRDLNNWTNSAASKVTAMMSSLQVTNNLSSVLFQSTNGIVIGATGNGSSNFVYSKSGTNDMRWRAQQGTSDELILSNLIYTVMDVMCVSNAFNVIGTMNVTNGIIQTTNTSAANQGVTIDPSKNYSLFSGGAVGIGTTGITNSAAAQFNYINLQASTNCGWGVMASNGTCGTTISLLGYEEFVIAVGGTIVQLGDATTNKGHHISITCGGTGAACSSAVTNAITTVSSQKIAGATKWTNTAVFTCTQLISDGSNWQLCGTRGN